MYGIVSAPALNREVPAPILTGEPSRPQRKAHSEALGARDQERQIEVEEVVPFDHVGVELAQPLRHPRQ